MPPALYETPLLREISGDALRPGGLEPTSRALEVCAFAAGSRLLDAGCGPGATLALLRGRGFSCLGVEQRRDFAAEARKNGPVIRADLRTLPLVDAGLAGAFCECVLSLFADKSAVLRELHRVLERDGKLIVTDLFAPAADGSAPGGCAAGAMPPADFEALLSAHGFAVIHREDYSRCLRELAARMAWHSGSVQAFMEKAGVARACGAKLSYLLFIAKKRRPL